MITIQANKNGRRVLILDSLFDLESNENFPESMFDVVFIVPPSLSEAKTILGNINPVTSEKCCFKPLFVSKELEGKLGEYGELVDGYSYDIDEDSVLTKTEEIILYRNEIGLQRSSDRLTSANLFFVRLCRYLISRKLFRLVPVPQEGSSMGYVIPIFDLFYRLGRYTLNEYIVFCQSMQEKEYFRVDSFVNKIHLCPECLRSHLLYIECCPQCGSSSIRSEEVIHHFRCANISPEHTYNFGGQLRCPKCHQLLRHIGVDYDRPSTVYTCDTCENNFLQPHMKALCTSCHKELDVVTLVPHDIVVFEITEEGRAALVSPNIGFTVYTDFYDNYLEYDRFVNRLRLLVGQKELEISSLSVVRIWVLSKENATASLTTDFIALFCSMFPNRKVSSANHMVYIKETEHDRNDMSGDKFRSVLHECLLKAAALINPGEKVCYARSVLENSDPAEVETFINDLSYVSSEPEESFDYIRRKEERREEEAAPERVSWTLTAKEPEERQPEPEPVHGPERISRRQPGTDWMRLFRIFMLLSAVVAVVLVLCILFQFAVGRMENPAAPHAVQPVAETSVAQPGEEPDKTDETDSIDETDEINEMEETDTGTAGDLSLEKEKPEPADPYALAPLTPGYRYVVVGAFGTSYKAQKEARRFAVLYPSFTFRVHRYGRKYIVTSFRAESKAACEAFTNEYGYLFPGRWIL